MLYIILYHTFTLTLRSKITAEQRSRLTPLFARLPLVPAARTILARHQLALRQFFLKKSA